MEVILGFGFGEGVLILDCFFCRGCVLFEYLPVGSRLRFLFTFLKCFFEPSDSEPSALENKSVTFS